MKLIVAGIVALGTVSFALAPQYSGATDSNLSLKLGTVLGSEAFCGLNYDQDAIRELIEKNVSADDTNFATALNTETSVAAFENEHMSASEKTARCTQIRRVAKSYGFVK